MLRRLMGRGRRLLRSKEAGELLALSEVLGWMSGLSRVMVSKNEWVKNDLGMERKYCSFSFWLARLTGSLTQSINGG